jgi:hypothetical protein
VVARPERKRNSAYRSARSIRCHARRQAIAIGRERADGLIQAALDLLVDWTGRDLRPHDLGRAHAFRRLGREEIGDPPQPGLGARREDRGQHSHGRKPDPDAEAGKLRAACRRHVGSGKRIKLVKNGSRIQRFPP